MALHSGIDTIAIAAHGCFTKSSSDLNNIFASMGYLEDLPNPASVYIELNTSYGVRIQGIDAISGQPVCIIGKIKITSA